MFVDFGNKYLAPAKPRWKNPPSRYRKPERPKRAPYRKGKYLNPERRGPRPKVVQPKVVKPRIQSPRGMAPRSGGAVVPAVKPILKRALRVFPYGRIVSYAWDAYDFYNWTQGMEWGITAQGGLDMSGWVQCCDTGHRPLDSYYYTRARPSAGQWPNAQINPCAYFDPLCGLGGQVIHGPASALPIVMTPYASRTIFILRLGPRTGTHMRFAQVWAKPHNGAVPLPLPAVAAPVVQPLPVYDFARFPDWDLDSRVESEPQAEPDLAGIVPPYVVPALQFAPDNPYRRAKRGGDLAPHYQLPPKPNEKEEKKVIMKQLAGQTGVGPIFGAYTEALDAVDALYKAIPGAPEKMSYNGKLAYIAKHIGDVQWSDALWNFLKNELEDRAYAKLQRFVNSPVVKGGRAAKYWPFPTGNGGRWTRPPRIPAVR